LVYRPALLFQLRYDIGYFVGSLLECFELFAIGGLIVALFHRELAAITRNKDEEVPLVRAFSVTDRELRLDRDHFTGRDFLILQNILSGAKYETIASEQRMGLSTLKERLASLFSLLEVRNKAQFLGRYEKHALVWNEGQPEEAEQNRAEIIEFQPRS
jgi:DNA-binding NarL/FixJ family response regulator